MQTIEKVISDIKRDPQVSKTAWGDYPLLWKSLGFSKCQVDLWLNAINQNQCKDNVTAPYSDASTCITDHLLMLLRQSGGRMPLALVLKKLPTGITTSEQQIRKLAQQHAQLDIKGPLLILVN